jgi:hypothetical protein
VNLLVDSHQTAFGARSVQHRDKRLLGRPSYVQDRDSLIGVQRTVNLDLGVVQVA